MTFASLHNSAHGLLHSWAAPTRSQQAIAATMLAFLDSAPQGCARANVAGHITASALVATEDLSHVLLTLHPRIGTWVQLGGHCEDSDDTVTDAALREATEESGIANLVVDPELLAVDTHALTCSLGQPTRHLDLRFLITALATDSADLPTFQISDESMDLRWWPSDGLPEGPEADAMAELVDFARMRRAR